MSEIDYVFFPLRNENGFKVTGLLEYQHMINTIVEARIELAENYPDQKILVIYLAGLGE